MTNIEFDEEGYLLDLSQWSEALAESIATKEGLELTEAHWEILRVLRNFYEQFEVSPAMRPLVKAVTKELGADKGKSIYLMKLFPGSPPKLAAKIAGLPKPANCL
ncbi:MAG: sulfurtransferase TusE [Marinomonas sp.]|jgi:tRNA 2-thiouridine synthesizing protein E|uniref:Sulfurtransferase n=1 Tax=Marinomonas communis TaxID=28254 RepID=A0A4R6XCD5_9GAMM|nr:TusE/DsrC/DsvC family sulfur relay protein [Marinomonas communis]MEC8082311.1 TusE/DsrC/DsvC family sulfur relay protein [Pseudomonadota bacterium]RUM54015.1 MAG: sulfurtransferase TusE [Marinomonas sp.]MCC4272887.1 TusE/DsrC/DsvC family sulfur relay protein [Marinomonas communis]MEC8483092.1 TusE/DsrC/DsvC family sulfur relay protein [Pseudomonadota bacterium]TDR15799.1 tRNA 2-thiouridine synthesizing protein E [Marinomonas communis]|tara:strand:+ start:140 stop:454 length:315 start_codon:yes stop_codon:yes gene_type:complete